MGSLTDGGGTDKTRKEKEAPPGFEPGMADLQSAALASLATAPEENRDCDHWSERAMLTLP